MHVIRLFLSISLGGASALLAQSPGAVEGSVYDPAGLRVPSASVEVLDPQTGAVRRAATDFEGRYLVPALPPGMYRIEAIKVGFKRSARGAVALEAGRSIRVDFRLELGEERETVVVTAEAPLISPSASHWSTSTERRRLESLPLNGRDLFDLATLEPGAVTSTTAMKSITNGTGVSIAVNGARPNQNSFRLDGIYMNDATSLAPASASGRLLGVEGIQELHLVTSPFSAEYGRAAGAAFTAVSRSGGNGWHGSLYEFFRNSALDARNFFDNPSGKTPPLRTNQFGALIGGPIRRNRLFFLGNYEAIRQTTSLTGSFITLNAEARLGQLPGRTVTVAPEVIPYMNLFPLPNGRDFGGGTAEYTAELATRTREDYAAGKVDLLASERLRLSTRYTLDDGNKITPDSFQRWIYPSTSRYQFVHNQAEYVASPRTIHAFRAGFSRVRNTDTSIQPENIPASMSFVQGRPMGSIRVTGLTRLIDQVNQLPRSFVVNDFQVQYDLTHIRGAHSLSTGIGFDRIQFNQRSDIVTSGLYVFNSVADFLTGKARTGELVVPGSDTTRGWRLNQFFVFVQDEVRLRPGLSLSLGARYEMSTVPTEVQGKIATLPDPLHDKTTTVGGPLFINPSKDNIAPRAALAWDPFGSGKTVLRAGAGIFFDLMGTRDLIISGVRMPPFFERLTIQNATFPDLLQAALSGTPSLSPEGLDFRPNQPYLLQYQFGLQRMLGADTMAVVGYAGSRGVHLSAQMGEVNPNIPTLLADGRMYVPPNPTPTNPAFGRIRYHRMLFNSYYHSLTASVQRKWRSGLALQASYTFGKLIDENSSTINRDFTQSDQIPTVFNFRQNRGPGDFDVRHVFTANFSYALPAVHGRAGRVLGGWELQGLLQARTGHPFSPIVGFDRARISTGSFELGQRPNYVGAAGAGLILGDPQRYFDPTAFGLPDAGFLGNLGRNALTGPGLVSLDAGFHKILWRDERHDLRLRLEVFNLSNHPNFQIPSDRSLFNSQGQRLGSAGRITETSTSARQIQLALKWVF